ncbi:hypothetical protein IFM89_001195 [Coptis chinensis]|uniref:phosphopyruvate hydratase n=1 Tax=Coptis chinensis TaxID=261450 RepID=A0A835MBC7_9MAGN|nr:hypothetical protein IFM89_001195 [Coptis chinensis]
MQDFSKVALNGLSEFLRHTILDLELLQATKVTPFLLGDQSTEERVQLFQATRLHWCASVVSVCASASVSVVWCCSCWVECVLGACLLLLGVYSCPFGAFFVAVSACCLPLVPLAAAARCFAAALPICPAMELSPFGILDPFNLFLTPIKIGMDVATSEFLTKDGRYDLNFKKQPNDGAHVLHDRELRDLYKRFCRDFPIVSIEDHFDQNDWSAWVHSVFRLISNLLEMTCCLQIPRKLPRLSRKKACNALLLKASVNNLSPVVSLLCI